MTSRAVTKLLTGKKIVSVDLRPWGKAHGSVEAQNVEIILDDGTRLRFSPQDTDGDQGVAMIISREMNHLYTDRPKGKL